VSIYEQSVAKLFKVKLVKYISRNRLCEVIFNLSKELDDVNLELFCKDPDNVRFKNIPEGQRLKMQAEVEQRYPHDGIDKWK